MNTPTKQEPFLPPKELGDALAALGHVGFDLIHSRKLVRAARAAGYPIARKKYIRASDAAAFLVAHPDWSPYSKKSSPAGLFSLPT